jgi:acyl carrier protein
MEEYVARLATVLARVMEEPGLARTITPDTSILHDLGVDSLHMISFLLAIEDEFDVQVPFESLELEHLDSMRSLCHFVLGVPIGG